MAQWKFSKHITAKRRREFASIFGKNVWHFGPKICTTHFEDLRWTAEYKILWANEYSAVVQFKNKQETRCHHLFLKTTTSI